MLSVIIPSRQERYLNRTIQSVLDNATGEIEVFPVLDGYWLPESELIGDDRVKYIRLPNNGQMQKRQGINAAVSLAKGEFVMSLDAHCMVAPGFDVILTRDCTDNMVMIPRRYKLDPDKWCFKDEEGRPPIDYEYWKWSSFNEGYLKNYRWDARSLDRQNIAIDDMLTFQGSCWVMRKDYFERMRFMDTKLYTGWGQEDVELGLETWLNGGRVVVNKNTFYAHLFKGKTYGRMYKANQRQHEISRRRAFEHWCLERREEFFNLLQRFAPIPNWPLLAG